MSGLFAHRVLVSGLISSSTPLLTCGRESTFFRFSFVAGALVSNPVQLSHLYYHCLFVAFRLPLLTVYTLFALLRFVLFDHQVLGSLRKMFYVYTYVHQDHD